MAASVLSSARAVQMSIFVVRAFVGFRQMFQSNEELMKKLDKLESKYDAQFDVVRGDQRGHDAKGGFEKADRVPAACLIT